VGKKPTGEGKEVKEVWGESEWMADGGKSQRDAKMGRMR